MAVVLDFLARILDILISWPFLVFLFVVTFRNPLGQHVPRLLSGLKLIKTPVGEFAFEPTTTTTDLGLTSTARVAVKRSNAGLVVLDAVQESYVADDFLISWPTPGWEADLTQGSAILDQMGGTPNRKLPLFVKRKDVVDGFQPNVNVIVMLTDARLDEFVEQSKQEIKTFGWEILSSQIKQDSGVALMTFKHPTGLADTDIPLYQFNRIALASGKAYVITASMALATLESGRRDVRDELSSIVNSFRFIV